MSNISNRKNLDFINYKRILITLIAILAIITIIYQSRIFLDDAQFAWISVSAYTGIPLIMTVYSVILTIKLGNTYSFGTGFTSIFVNISKIFSSLLLNRNSISLRYR